MDTTVLFKAYVDLANSERQAIWARNASMLVANALILNVSGSNAIKSPILISLAGIGICLFWFAMTVMGWNRLYAYNRLIRSLDESLPLNIGNSFDGTRASILLIVVLVSLLYVAAIAQ